MLGVNARVIKLGRIFMLAWLAFYFYPLGLILTGGFSSKAKFEAIAVLLASGIVWAWFWTRIEGGPDARLAPLAVVLGALLIGAFTLMTPPRYGTLVVSVAVMAGVAVPWRRAIPLVLVIALGGVALDLIRGVGGLQAGGEGLNDAIVGFAGVGGRLLLEANRELSRAREQIARLAVGEERLRFARDLHDLLGHSLSVITLKSELAGRLISRTPELAAAEVTDIEKVAREALREVREAVAGYRQPTLAAELAGAREALTAAGIDCRVEDKHGSLSPAIESVLAWSVREGTTNVMRHSKARRCTIRILTDAASAKVEVVDDGAGGLPEPGSGLLGLRERVQARGGTMSAEPLAHGGFRLKVALPLQEAVPVSSVPA